MYMMSLLLLAATPSAEAERLGRRLAEQGMLATVLPLMIAQQTEELVAAHPELDSADRATLRVTAAATGRAGLDKAIDVSGHACANALSVGDLRKLVAAADRPEAKRQRAAQPGVIAAIMTGLRGMDFKRDVMTAFCKQTGKACAVK